jgi:uncharacterized membrane protein YccF (DUF307 family)
MSLFGNIIWFIFGGLISAALWLFSGLLLCLTIVGIPFGLQCFKFAIFVLWPFGRDVEIGQFGALGLFGNIIWIIFCGFWLCLTHLFFALLLCLTIIGIPFGLQHFKLAKLSLMPFGAKIIDRGANDV